MMFVNKKLVYVALLTSLTQAAQAAQAPENHDSNRKAAAVAHLDTASIRGIVEFTSTKHGTVEVHLDVTGLPPNSGPFQYHVHDSHILPNDDCYKNGQMFNPYEAEYEVCDDFDDDSLCAVGDLSGKHGFINTTCFETYYDDLYLSLNPHNAAFIGDKSVIVTDADNNLITYGNIMLKKAQPLSTKQKLLKKFTSASVTDSEEHDSPEEDDEGGFLADGYDSEMQQKNINNEIHAHENFMYNNNTNPVRTNTTTNTISNPTVNSSFVTTHGNGGSIVYDSSSNMLLTSGLIAMAVSAMVILL